MSAIWGAIDIKKDEFRNETKQKLIRMKEPFCKYKIDHLQELQEHNYHFGCGLQYITLENEKEQLPFCDEKKDIVLTADCYLDNRKELLNELEMAENLTDSQIIYYCYCRWGEASFKKLLGVFSFVLYDRRRKCTFCVTDFAASRCLYYYTDQGIFYFSTLLKPIMLASDHGENVNESWLVDFLAPNSMTVASNNGESFRKDIMKLEPAEYIIVTEEGIKKCFYWKEPERYVTKRKTDEEYQREFISVFDRSVRACMRSSMNTGMLLSGGLDSSEVAGFASKVLKKTQQKLYSFTSVPEEDYISDQHKYYNVNERSLVEHTAEFLGNVECSFIDMPGKTLWDNLDDMLEKIEIPYKAVPNVSWMSECLKQANEKECHIVLNGQYGNATVSFGNRVEYYLSLMLHGHVVKLLKNVNAVGRYYHISRKYLAKVILKKWAERMGERFAKSDETGISPYLTSKAIEEFNVRKKLEDKKIINEKHRIYTMEESLSYCYFADALSQIGEIETKMGLVHGILIRDPTRDRRLIEFCYRLPLEQYVHGIYERRLVTQYSAQYISSHIIDTSGYLKGIQSADMRNRLAKQWSSIKDDMMKIIMAGDRLNIINLEILREQIPRSAEELIKHDDFYAMQQLYYIMVLKMLQKC